MPPKKRSYEPPPQPVGDLYARPLPNPFTPEWVIGYNDGYDKNEYKPSGNPVNYRDGYVCGEETLRAEKEEMDRLGSSNA